MALFQKSVLAQHLNKLDKTEVEDAFARYKEVYLNSEKIDNIKSSKEEQYQEGFLDDIFVKVLGYTKNPEPNFNLTTELKNVDDAKKADGAILLNDEAIAVIELKSTSTTDIKSIEQQAFNYKNHQPKCVYVITSNFHKFRLYIENATDYEDFDLFNMDLEKFKLFYLCLNKDNILSGKTLTIKNESHVKEEDISLKLYKDYSAFKNSLFDNLVKNNSNIDKVILLKKSQKLLDRFLFVFFAEDRGLIPANFALQAIEQNENLKKMDLAQPLYSTFIKFFSHLDKGSETLKIPGYNGGLFATDEILDNLKIDDEALLDDVKKLSAYDFQSEIDANILGHIFENSLSDIEELHAKIDGVEFDKTKTKRKKDGVFYTPKYITKYIVENTVGALCEEKKKELDLVDVDIPEDTRTLEGKIFAKFGKILKKLEIYREYLLSLKILDPACGSGAFLIQALNFLMDEHKVIDELIIKITHQLPYENIDISILENNLYGVDINDESVEIAKLSLWLQTAIPGRKLSNLSGNIKCGNSLIDDVAVAGDKAFDWDVEFEEIMGNGGFDVVIGNPPYVRSDALMQKDKLFYTNNWFSAYKQYDLYIIFYELGLKLLNQNGLLGFITPNKFYMAEYGKRCREYILKNSSIVNISDVSMMNIFQDASVYPTIITLKKEVNLKNIIKIKSKLKLEDDLIQDKYEIIEQIEYTNAENYVISLNISNRDLTVKIEKQSQIIKDIFQITRGFRPPVKKLLVTSKVEGAYPMLIGSALNKAYNINWDGVYVLYNTDKIYEAKPLNTFLQPKILIRDIGLKFNAYFDNGAFLCLKTIYFIYGADETTLKFTTVLLNSKLLNFYFFEKYSSMHISGGYLRFRKQFIETVPVKIISNQQPFIEKGDKMLELNSSFQKKKNKFLNRVTTLISESSESKEVKLSKNINSFYESDFTAFIKELKKKKVSLSLKQQDEWEDYFEDYKKDLVEIKTEIDKTDSEIDKMVYELYGLTDEEIRIVEGSV